ncbi:hypothetical protein [Sphingomonas lenta]|uniref:Uncharacterized protein n=1 Tax=Sphingomonas lenta TaxID=1141887 RepID=A0A2A2SFQ9_9SPHN|nr:hypothetical protein [Sphingomonas lenta]PAX08089.1 hypothetical protein CKY28_10900 [Sphingomonas lenta]
MTDHLLAFTERSLRRPVPDFVRAVAGELAGEGVRAVLFYGSNLRTGSADGVLDFYVLTEGERERGIWPRVGYREFVHDGATLRAKIATMTLATFARAAAGRMLDTTVWARFVQPSALVWSADAQAAEEVVAAVSAAAATAARFAAALGPKRGSAEDYWRALFRATYAAEFRVEKRGRGDEIVAHDRERYAELLPLAWEAAGVAFGAQAGVLAPSLPVSERARVRSRWGRSRRAGKPLNLLRLVRAASTFEGAARYGAWKIERHTGVRVALTPWRERHPVLAAPGVLWRVWRERRSS